MMSRLVCNFRTAEVTAFKNSLNNVIFTNLENLEIKNKIKS